MDILLNHPAFQSGIAPFLISAVIAGIFIKIRVVAGLSIVAGFVLSVWLTTGFSFEPLTATRKIILLILTAPILGILLSISNRYSENVLKLFYVIAALGMLWILWPVLNRNPSEMLLPVLGYMLYAAWMAGIFLRLSETSSLAAGAATSTVGIGVGICALIGASALLGQMGLAVGAAGMAYLAIQLFFNRDEEAGFTLTVTTGFATALILPAAVVYAKVPWIVLPIIAIVPIFAFYPFEDDQSTWKNTLSLIAVMALPIAYAAYLTVESAGELLL